MDLSQMCSYTEPCTQVGSLLVCSMVTILKFVTYEQGPHIFFYTEIYKISSQYYIRYLKFNMAKTENLIFTCQTNSYSIFHVSKTANSINLAAQVKIYKSHWKLSSSHHSICQKVLSVLHPHFILLFCPIYPVSSLLQPSERNWLYWILQQPSSLTPFSIFKFLYSLYYKAPGTSIQKVNQVRSLP